MEKTGFSEITIERLTFNNSGFWFCEIAITGLCNFACEYCNKITSHIDLKQITKFIEDNKNTLRHIQLTGGEPTLYPQLVYLCNFIKEKNIKLGLSTNGSADFDLYTKLNVDLFSISLDDYDVEILKRRGYRKPSKIINNIKLLSKEHYINVGLVIDSLNCSRIENIIEYILSLDANDIKLSVSTKDEVVPIFNKEYLNYPILNYRVNRFKQGKNMRGIENEDFNKCGLMRSDISIVENKHYPCLVYARENGNAIGLLDDDIKKQREDWYETHQPNLDPICKKYCMDFKCEFNKEYQKLNQS